MVLGGRVGVGPMSSTESSIAVVDRVGITSERSILRRKEGRHFALQEEAERKLMLSVTNSGNSLFWPILRLWSGKERLTVTSCCDQY